VEFKMRENGASVLKNRVPSDAGTESSWEIGGHRWVNRRAQSDPGIGMQGAQPPDIYKRLHHGAAMAEEQKKEQDTDLQTPPNRKWRLSGSPPPSRTPDKSW